MRLCEFWNEDEEGLEHNDDAGGVDWQAYADEILEIVDEQLAAFDLEVVEYDTCGDDFMWRIDRRAAPGPDSEAAKLRRLEAERARRSMGELRPSLLKSQQDRDHWRSGEGKRTAAARATVNFLHVHLGDRFAEFEELLNKIYS